MEKLLHYTWRHKMFPLGDMHTTDGRRVEVINVGLYNQSDAGPDFFNAKLKVDGLLWVGNVEIHIKASDWYRHHHDQDAAYNNVVMHVVEEADMDVCTQEGKRLPTLVIPIPDHLRQDYAHLLLSEKYPPCYQIIPSLPSLKVHAWLGALQTERLERKTRDMEALVEQLGGSWDDAYFAMVAHGMGFGTNSEALNIWARSLPLRSVDHHRDNLFQVEAMFLGHAGLLNRVDERYTREFLYLQRKFSLTPMTGAEWRYLRTRPQNFPHVRLMQLARMYHERRTSLSMLVDCKTVKDVGRLYDMKGQKLSLMVINTAVPALFAYGRHSGKEYLCEMAFDWLDSLKAEDNTIVRMWAECGLAVDTAGASQALIQLKRQYCDRKDCLRCRFGYEFLSSDFRSAFLNEKIKMKNEE